jgi:hypothetical protein
VGASASIEGRKLRTSVVAVLVVDERAVKLPQTQICSLCHTVSFLLKMRSDCALFEASLRGRQAGL